MEHSDIKTDVEIMKKLMFGNGVKGLIKRVEEIAEQQDEMEIYMNKNLAEFQQKLLNKIDEKKKFNITSWLTVLGILVVIAQDFIS
jgi:NAD-dependent DNA ligase